MKSFTNLLVLVVLFLFASTAIAKNEKKEKSKKLPPGLQKKVEKGKPLPPGWQKKLRKGEILDVEVYRQSKVVVPVDDKGVVTVTVDGRIIRLIEATREIVGILKTYQ